MSPEAIYDRVDGNLNVPRDLAMDFCHLNVQDPISLPH